MKFDYDELYKPYTHKLLSVPHTLNLAIGWIKSTTKADQDVVDMAVSETMQMLAQGEKFDTSGDFPNAKIDKHMLKRAFELKQEASVDKVKMIEKNDVKKFKVNKKALTKFEREYYVEIHGNWWDRFMYWATTYEGVI